MKERILLACHVSLQKLDFLVDEGSRLTRDRGNVDLLKMCDNLRCVSVVTELEKYLVWLFGVVLLPRGLKLCEISNHIQQHIYSFYHPSLSVSEKGSSAHCWNIAVSLHSH
jgi:hypothetical protein